MSLTGLVLIVLPVAFNVARSLWRVATGVVLL